MSSLTMFLKYFIHIIGLWQILMGQGPEKSKDPEKRTLVNAIRGGM
jgi:hypothetical protein